MLYNKLAFGIVISRLRVGKEMSQETLSALAGISRSHLALLESGKKTVRLDTLWQIAYALDVQPHELISLTEQDMPYAKK